MSKRTPVALQQPKHIFLFKDDGVTMHAHDEICDLFPKTTWTLSDSDGQTAQPCAVFLNDSQWACTWLVQTTSIRTTSSTCPMEIVWNKLVLPQAG